MYVCEDLTRAQILDAEGVRKHDLRLMVQDFELQHAWAREKEKPVYHNVLSFPHGEDPGDEKMVEITHKFLQKVGLEHTQCAIVKHLDKTHIHLHIIANRVDNAMEVTGKGLIIERGIKAARKLTEEYNLRKDYGKNLGQTNLRALHEPDKKRYRLYLAIGEALPVCRNMDDLERRLLEKGISTRYRIDRESGERQGISFRIEKYCFQGGRVDRAYTLRGLEKTLQLQQELAMRRELELKQALDLKQALELQQRQAEERKEELEQQQALQLRYSPRLSR